MTRLGELQWFTSLKYLPFGLHPDLGGCEVSAFTKMCNSDRKELTTKNLPFFKRFHPRHNSPLHKNWTYHCLLFQLLLKPLGWSLNTGQRWCQICAESPQWCEMSHWRQCVAGSFSRSQCYPSSHNHYSLHNGCISSRVVTFQIQPKFTEPRVLYFTAWIVRSVLDKAHLPGLFCPVQEL